MNVEYWINIKYLHLATGVHVKESCPNGQVCSRRTGEIYDFGLVQTGALTPSQEKNTGKVLCWRHQPDLNWWMKVLQTFALPLGDGATLQS